MKKIEVLIDRFLTNERYIIVSLFFLALVIRLLYFVNVYKLPAFKELCYDSKIFDGLAQEVIHNSIFLKNYKVPFEMSPGYTYFLALFSSIFKCKLSLVKIAQLLIGSLNCILIYFIGKKLFNKCVGIIAGIIASYYGIFIFFEGILMPEFLILFFNSLMILSLLKAKEKPTPKYWFLGGICLGLSSITRPNILLFIPFILFWIYSLKELSKKERFKFSIYFCLAVAVMIMPVTIRNYMVGKDLVLITSSGGMNFYGGNNPASQGVFVTSPEKFKCLINLEELSTRGIQISSKMNEHQRDKAVASLLLGKKVKPSKTSIFWFKQGLKNIIKAPFWWFTLEIKKLILLFNSYEVQDGDIPFSQMQRDSALLRIPVFCYGAIFPLGIAGIILAFKERKKFNLIYFFILSYIISMLIFHIASRYRLPLVPFLIIFGAYVLYYCYTQIREKRWELLLSPLIFFIILASIVNYDDTFGYDFELNRAFIPMHEQQYNFFMKNKEYLKATDSAERLTELNPKEAKAFISLGWAYFNSGAIDKAIESYKRAIDLDPYLMIAYMDLALAYYGKGAINEAIDVYKHIEKMFFKDPFVYNILGHLFAENEQYKEAEQGFRKAVNLFPKEITFSFDLANLFLVTGQYEKASKGYEYILKSKQITPSVRDRVKEYLEITRLEKEIKEHSSDVKTGPLYQRVGRFWYDKKYYNKAIEKMEKLVVLLPNDVMNHYNLGQAYKACGYYQKAKSEYEKALKIKPDFIAAAVQLDRLRGEE